MSFPYYLDLFFGSEQSCAGAGMSRVNEYIDSEEGGGDEPEVEPDWSDYTYPRNQTPWTQSDLEEHVNNGTAISTELTYVMEESDYWAKGQVSSNDIDDAQVSAIVYAWNGDTYRLIETEFSKESWENFYRLDGLPYVAKVGDLCYIILKS